MRGSDALRGARGRIDAVCLSSVSRAVRRERLTYLTPAKLRALERLLRLVNRRRVPGDVVEAGVALGGSAIVMASRMGSRRFHGYDVFGTIPAPSAHDSQDAHDRYLTIASGSSAGIGGDEYYGYTEELYARVVDSFARNGHVVDGTRVTLHRGLFEDTLNPDRPIAVAHIDSDWYEPVKLALERIWPALSPGGFIVLDDYNDYAGCRHAAEVFLSTTPAAALERTRPSAVIAKPGGVTA